MENMNRNQEPQKNDLIVKTPTHPKTTRFYSKFPIGHSPPYLMVTDLSFGRTNRTAGWTHSSCR
jgi:hypothetical protein